MSEKIEIEESTGNVFADLGLPDADERMAKADLSIAICRIIETRGLTQREAADILGASQPDVSDLKHGRLSGFSMGRLYRYLNALDQDVRIVVRPRPKSRKRAEIRVAAGS